MRAATLKGIKLDIEMDLILLVTSDMKSKRSRAVILFTRKSFANLACLCNPVALCRYRNNQRRHNSSMLIANTEVATDGPRALMKSHMYIREGNVDFG